MDIFHGIFVYFFVFIFKIYRTIISNFGSSVNPIGGDFVTILGRNWYDLGRKYLN